MSKTKIEWTDYSWNPWRGCTKVSPGCANCYAETLGRRFGVGWGPGAVRVQASEATWRDPLRWNKYVTCECGGVRYPVECPTERMVECPGCHSGYGPPRVFALSMGDWLEGEPRTVTHGGHPQGGVPSAWLARMLDTIRLTPNLNWMLLTKRPENFEQRIRDAGFHLCTNAGQHRDALADWLAAWLAGTPPQNVCVMTSVEDQQRADERIPALLSIPARWRGLSMEPLLGPIEMGAVPGGMKSPIWHDQRIKIDWLVIGGESGPRARPCSVDWIRDLARQGKRAGRATFCKQMGSNSISGDPSDECHRMKWKDPKGGDQSEWPEDLRVREWPEGL